MLLQNQYKNITENVYAKPLWFREPKERKEKIKTFNLRREQVDERVALWGMLNLRSSFFEWALEYLDPQSVGLKKQYFFHK